MFSSFCREGKGRKVGGKGKNVVFSSFFKNGKEKERGEIRLIFLSNVGEKGRKRNEN